MILFLVLRTKVALRDSSEVVERLDAASFVQRMIDEDEDMGDVFEVYDGGEEDGGAYLNILTYKESVTYSELYAEFKDVAKRYGWQLSSYKYTSFDGGEAQQCTLLAHFEPLDGLEVVTATDPRMVSVDTEVPSELHDLQKLDMAPCEDRWALGNPKTGWWLIERAYECLEPTVELHEGSYPMARLLPMDVFGEIVEKLKPVEDAFDRALGDAASGMGGEA